MYAGAESRAGRVDDYLGSYRIAVVEGLHRVDGLQPCRNHGMPVPRGSNLYVDPHAIRDPPRQRFWIDFKVIPLSDNPTASRARKPLSDRLLIVVPVMVQH